MTNDRDRRFELVNDTPPRPEVLGSIRADSPLLSPTPRPESASWTSGAGGQIDMTEPPPPWEQAGGDMDFSDARNLVEYPSTWTVRWINPKLLDQFGWRHWQPVTLSTPGVRLKVDSMAGPDGIIRRGGQTGDVLGWMYTSWVVSARKKLQERTEQQSASAVNKQHELEEEFRRGRFGPNLRFEGATHPTHTTVEGRSIKD